MESLIIHKIISFLNYRRDYKVNLSHKLSRGNLMSICSLVELPVSMPEVQDQVMALLEQQEFVNSFPVNYVIKTVKGSTKDLKQFQDYEWLVAGNHQKKVKM